MASISPGCGGGAVSPSSVVGGPPLPMEGNLETGEEFFSSKMISGDHETPTNRHPRAQRPARLLHTCSHSHNKSLMRPLSLTDAKVA